MVSSSRENRHDESSDQSPSEVDKRRDEALRRALTTPPKPHKAADKEEADRRNRPAKKKAR